MYINLYILILSYIGICFIAEYQNIDPFVNIFTTILSILTIFLVFDIGQNYYEHFEGVYTYIIKRYNSWVLTKKIEELEDKYNTKLLVLTDLDSDLDVDNVFTLEDCEKFIRRVRNTDRSNITIILHTEGGSIFSSDKIVNTILNCDKKVKAYIPYYAHSAGSLIALSCDQIFMTKYSFMGPTDPQIGIDYKKGDYDLPSKAFIKKGDYNNDLLHLHHHEADILHKDNLRLLDKIFRGMKHKKGLKRLFGSGDHPHSRSLTYDELDDAGLNYLEQNVPQDFIDLIDDLI